MKISPQIVIYQTKDGFYRSCILKELQDHYNVYITKILLLPLHHKYIQSDFFMLNHHAYTLQQSQHLLKKILQYYNIDNEDFICSN